MSLLYKIRSMTKCIIHHVVVAVDLRVVKRVRVSAGAWHPQQTLTAMMLQHGILREDRVWTFADVHSLTASTSCFMRTCPGSMIMAYCRRMRPGTIPSGTMDESVTLQTKLKAQQQRPRAARLLLRANCPPRPSGSERSVGFANMACGSPHPQLSCCGQLLLDISFTSVRPIDFIRNHSESFTSIESFLLAHSDPVDWGFAHINGFLVGAFLGVLIDLALVVQRH